MNAGLSFGDKCRALAEELAGYERVAVAFSGGVDSSVLLHAAVHALGDGALAVIADSPSLPRRELTEAKELARSLGVELVVVGTRELEDPRYAENAGERCYFCKYALFDAMRHVARERSIPKLAFGKIQDDALDHRPGERAAQEFGVCAPLDACGFTKEDVRRYARRYDLPVAEKPASACLASRIPVGTQVTAERLAVVEAAEEDLRELGLGVLRVRHHGSKARLELGPREYLWVEQRADLLRERLASHGFEDVEFARYRQPQRS